MNANKTLFSIGEFSKITGLTVKTLRHYHDIKLLIPAHINEESDYRFYNISQIEKAKIIVKLKDLQIPLNSILHVLQNYNDDFEIISFLENHLDEITKQLNQYKTISNTLNKFINEEKENFAMLEQNQYEIVEKNVETLLVASVHWRGKYQDSGKYFGKIGRKFARFINGKPLNIYHDLEYKSDDADIETCMPIKKGSSVDDVIVKELTGGRAVTLLYKGPYDKIGDSYAKILTYVKNKNYEISEPYREVYIKGPGMIFKGNPKNYLTEIIIFIK